MKTLVVLICFLVVIASYTADANAWGAVTHAYFAKELGNRWGLLNLQEIYGSTLPDMFNLLYGSPYKDYLWAQTHNEFDKYVDCVNGRSMEASAFGFVSHNDLWGADYTAHHDGRTTPGTGYVIVKVNILIPLLVPQLTDILNAAGIPNAAVIAQQLAPGLAENFVETAIDLLVKRNEDPAIGYRLTIAAQLRDFRVPFSLACAYARDFANAFGISPFGAMIFIIGAEKEYRDLMKLYGGIFTKSEDEAIGLLAAQGAELAKAALKAETGFDIDVPPAVLAAFLKDVAIPCVEPDYGMEISATLAYLESGMGTMALAEGPGPFPLEDEDKPDTPEARTFGLAQNFPNPFNPNTVIEYSLPVGCHVRLSVYNALGREVDILVDTYQTEGEHRVSWNAHGMPSGIYFYRIKAGSFTSTRKMCLLK